MSIEEQFNSKLKEFLSEDLSQEYSKYTPTNDKVLVKVFKFVPEENTSDLGRSTILVVSKLDGSLKPASIANNEKLFPIVKVIKKGKQTPDWVKENELYVVPYNDIVGDDWNPEFKWMMQNFSQKKGDGKPSIVTIPDDMPQRILKIDIHWERYKFSMPDRISVENETDKLVYLIPPLKLEAEYSA